MNYKEELKIKITALKHDLPKISSEILNDCTDFQDWDLNSENAIMSFCDLIESNQIIDSILAYTYDLHHRYEITGNLLRAWLEVKDSYLKDYQGRSINLPDNVTLKNQSLYSIAIYSLESYFFLLIEEFIEDNFEEIRKYRAKGPQYYKIFEIKQKLKI